MESIKVSELENTKQINENDLLMIIQDKKNKNIKVSDFLSNNIIELLTVSSIAPTECNIGDKYYNTTTSKIYTAIATNIWATTGENPSNLYLYADLEHKELYYYNGATFVSYGGGSGGGGDTLPVGSIIAYSSDTIPNGWLLCDGSSFSTTSYPELFEAIGVTYGWDDERNPKLPDLRGKVTVGKDENDTDFNTLGKTSGEKTHRHEFTIGQLYSYGVPIGDGFDNAGAYKDSTSNFAGTTGTITAKTTNKNTAIANSMDTNIEAGGKSSTGDTTLSSNLQPSLTLNYIIKAKNTVVVKGDVIQETDTASTTNVYSAKAIDNKLKTNITTGQEIATNEYIDGKRVYLKSFKITSLNDEMVVSNSIDYVKELRATVKDNSGGSWRTIPWVYNSNTFDKDFAGGILINSNGNVSFQAGVGLSAIAKGYVEVKYTKNA